MTSTLTTQDSSRNVGFGSTPDEEDDTRAWIADTRCAIAGRVRRLGLLPLVAMLTILGPLTLPSHAQVPPEFAQNGQGESSAGVDWGAQMISLQDAAVRLPFATALSTLLAYRPRRRGTPVRQLAVVQTQIILAIVGAIVMLVVGASVARAFGIVGAAGLIRYRAKVDDPKDAGVMLSTLTIGLASGVGQFLMAMFAAVFVLGTLWILESLEPEPYAFFALTIHASGANDLKPSVEQVLARHRVEYDLRGTSAEDIAYEVKMPLGRDTETISDAFAALDRGQSIEVKWERKKEGR